LNPSAGRMSALHWAIRLTVAFALALVSACIIGPKQDDPETQAATNADTGFAADDDARANPSDTQVPPADETGALTDATTSGDTAAGPDSGLKVDGGDGGGGCTDAADAGDAADGGCREDGGGDAVSGG
jgi:hypothetical protein